MGDWTTCPDCKGSGWADAVYEYTASQKKAYVEPCNTCRGVKEIFQIKG